MNMAFESYQEGKMSSRAAFPAPRYSQDSFFGGINRNVLAVDSPYARFFFGPLSNLEEGDVVFFFLGDDLSPVAQRPVSRSDEGIELSIDVPASELLRYVPDNSARRIDIWYAIVRPLEALESERLEQYLIDFAAPGGIPVFDVPYVNENLKPIPELESTIPPDTNLAINVPAWENMTIGDKLFVRWGGVQLDAFEITSVDQVGQAVSLTIPWETIEAEGSSARIDYYIRDVVKNTSYFSKPQSPIIGSISFPPPDVPEADDQNVLDGALSSATLVVDADANLLTDDIVEGFFAGQSLGKMIATSGLPLTFAIPGTLIAASRGKDVEAYYVVTRGTGIRPSDIRDTTYTSEPLSLFVTLPSSSWDETFDFDTSPISDVSSIKPGAQLQFDDVFHWFFDRNHLPSKEQFIGVKDITGSVADMYAGRVLRIGHDDYDTLIPKQVLCQFWKTWSRVRFAVSAIDDPVTIDFYEDLTSDFNDSWPSLKTVSLSPSARAQEVLVEAPSGKKIKWIRFKCSDTIHIDYFKMRAEPARDVDADRNWARGASDLQSRREALVEAFRRLVDTWFGK